MANRNRRVMQSDAMRCERDDVRIDVEHRSSAIQHTTRIERESRDATRRLSIGECRKTQEVQCITKYAGARRWTRRTRAASR